MIHKPFGRQDVRTVPLVDEWELYNLNDDPAEQQNLARSTEHREMLTQLKALLSQTRADMVPERKVAWPYAISP